MPQVSGSPTGDPGAAHATVNQRPASNAIGRAPRTGLRTEQTRANRPTPGQCDTEAANGENCPTVNRRQRRVSESPFTSYFEQIEQFADDLFTFVGHGGRTSDEFLQKRRSDPVKIEHYWQFCSLPFRIRRRTAGSKRTIRSTSAFNRFDFPCGWRRTRDGRHRLRALAQKSSTRSSMLCLAAGGSLQR